MRKLAVAGMIALGLAGVAHGQVNYDPQSFLPPVMEPQRPVPKGFADQVITRRPVNIPLTPVEAADFRATPTYDETIAWLRRLDRLSQAIRLETIGVTPQGRDIVMVIASLDGRRLDPRKPVVLAQAGIHAGEIDGKDAGMMLLRNLAMDARGNATLQKVNFLFIPMVNPDGHERASRYSRPNQRGPEIQGWRHNALNLNINRDYLKADSPEMRALLSVIDRYDPALYIDLHVTDGADHQFDVTFSFDGWDGRYADSPAIGRWLNSIYRPQIESSLDFFGHTPGPYIEMRSPANPAAGITQTAYTPRFSHAYGDLRRTPTVLVETHSLKPYARRVLGTAALLSESLGIVALQGANLRTAITTDRALRPTEIIATWRPVREPQGTFRFLPMETRTYRSEATGGDITTWTGRPAPALDVPVYVYEPGLRLPVAKTYWVPGSRPDVIERLAAHGVQMERIAAPRTVSVDMIRIGGFTAGAPTAGRFPVTGQGFTHETRQEVFPVGSARISSDQPLGALVAMLLEPEGPDSLFAWGFFPEMLQRVEYMEAYAIAPMADQMLKDPAIKARFEAALAADPALAASPQRRLQWFYRESPFYDQRYLLYPIGREP